MSRTQSLNAAYWQELRAHWRVLLAAFVGLGFGLSLGLFTSPLFGPPLLREFGWTRSQFALVSTVSIVMLLVLPFAGRLTDQFGVRKVALAGVIGVPLSEVALAMQSGSLTQFLALSALKAALGTLVSTTIYSSLVADRFVAARGFAFAVVMTGPALVGAFATPVLAEVIFAYGWRTGYLVLAAVTLAGGLCALAIVPAHAARKRRSENSLAEDFRKVARQPVFWLIVGGMFLCNMPQSLGSAQLKLMALDAGATVLVAVTMISAYAAGIVIGRFACGLALDRFAARNVAALMLCVPAFGFFGLWTDFDAPWFLIFAMVLVGVAQGAEGDVAAYLVTRYFDIRTYGFVMGMVASALSAASSAGALVLSATLRGGESYMTFLLVAVAVTLVGASLFLGLNKRPPASAEVIGATA
jgi:MFS family permease